MWPPDRRDQLSSLRRLLSMVAGLNDGSHFLGKALDATLLAKELMTTRDYSKPSLMRFLEEEACRLESTLEQQVKDPTPNDNKNAT